MALCLAWRTKGDPSRHIDGSIMQPLLALFGVCLCRRCCSCAAVYERLRDSPLGMASSSSHFGSEGFDSEAEYCVCESGLVSIKFTPLGHVTNPSLENGMHVFKTISSFWVSAMVHTRVCALLLCRCHQCLPHGKIPLRCAYCHRSRKGGFLYSVSVPYLPQAFDTIYLEPSSSVIESVMLLLGGSSVRRVSPSARTRQ